MSSTPSEISTSQKNTNQTLCSSTPVEETNLTGVNPTGVSTLPETTNTNQFAPNIIKDDAVRILKTCYDPEIPVNIYELGLIYEVAVDEKNFVTVKMTLTSPNCPAAESLPVEVQNKVKSLPGVTDVKVNIVWEPTWTKEMMSESALLQLGLM